ncbi:DUF7115 domain-containing protein [Haloterrigena alkaliphila]|uniref:DUF7115 domain-containing protein n=1 Tax=Haloterrigena alkaliphila TaxID=2816475 RepID=A0A8A2VC69_9EURY|nr:hypothetical protein [Haloterrigena alkaliphila]QSW99101.1 hypothetical protein J0X25_17240 [Haloterrigena alkaliphila]
MSVPGIVQSTLNGDEIAARVSLGGEDELFITSSSSIVYRSDGILSDESVDEYPHQADRLTLSEGRRKTKFTLEYPLEGAKSFSVPSAKTDSVLHPVLAGVLNGNGITDAGETVVKTYRFSELTLIITSDRLVKHIGAAVWDGDYEEYHFEDVTNLAFEDGSVATQIVLTAAGRPQRIKAPNEQANDLRERLKRALFEYHDVTSLEELNETVGEDEADEDERSGSSMDFGDGVDPLDANPPEPDDAPDEPADGAAGRGSAQSTDPLTTGQSSAGADASASQAGTGADRQRGQASQQETRTAPQSNVQSSDPDRDGAAVAEADTTFEMTHEQTAASVADSEPTETAGATDVESDTDSGRDKRGTVDPADGLTADSDASDPEIDPEALLERIDSLEAAVERQSDLIERQQETIEQLIAELRAGR